MTTFVVIVAVTLLLSVPFVMWFAWSTRHTNSRYVDAVTTGKSIDVQAIDIVRFGDDGLAHDHWGVFDAMKMMQQLGATP